MSAPRPISEDAAATAALRHAILKTVAAHGTIDGLTLIQNLRPIPRPSTFVDL